MSGRNWAAARQRRTNRRHGTEHVKRHAGMMAPLLTPFVRDRRPEPSKAEMRSESRRLLDEFLGVKSD